MIILNLFIISIICVFIFDYSGFVPEIEGYVTKMLNSRIPLRIPKPFSCGLCMTFWTSIIYLIIVNSLTFNNLLFVVLFCALTRVTLHGLYTLGDVVDRVLTFIDDCIK